MRNYIFILCTALVASSLHAERLGDFWNTTEAEAKSYPVVDIPIPDDLVIEASSFELLPDGRLAIGTRRGDIYLADGAFEENPNPSYQLFASGLDEVTSLAYRDGSFYVTQQTEVTRITDDNDDGRADQFQTLSDVWGFRNYHEFSFGSKPDPDGNIWVALCLSKSYESLEKFRGWALKVTPDGQTIPVASGIRSPCGVGTNSAGVMFYSESQGPWNGSGSLKHLKQGGFMGHPASFNWYPEAPNMGGAPVVPNSRSRLEIERKRVKELVPYAVVFPYRRMGQQLSGFVVDNTRGKFGPFADQIFIADYTLGIVMRVTTEEVNGVWQGACYPFREGMGTGVLSLAFGPDGKLMTGGTNRGWPVRGIRPFALQRIEWNGRTPFELKEINALNDGFRLTFTQPLNVSGASDPDAYVLETFTHIYQGGYGSPEVDQTKPTVTSATLSDDGYSVRLKVDGLVQGHVHDFGLEALRSSDGESLVHPMAYYTLNEIPKY